MRQLRERWFGPDSGDRYQFALVVLLALAGAPIVVDDAVAHIDDPVVVGALAGGAVLLGAMAMAVRHLAHVAQAWLPAAAAAYLAALVAVTGGAPSRLPVAFVLFAIASAFLHRSRRFAANLAWIVAMALLPFAYDREGAELRRSEGVLVALLVLLAVVIVVHVLSEVLRARNQRLHAVLDQQRATIEELQEAQAAKDVFLNALSHELRTPLTSIMGIGQTLQQNHERLEPAQRADLLDRLLSNGQRLHRLLTDLLDLRRLQEGATDLVLSPVHLPGLVASALAEVDARGRDVHTDVPRTTMDLDVSKVERIIVNLVSNASRHTPAGSSVWVRMVVEPQTLHITVADDGGGVADHLKLSVFEPFQQGPHSRDDPSPGTGIGLSIVDRFARLHGGDAWVEDRPGGGAIFHVRLAAAETRRTPSPARGSLHVGEPQRRPGRAHPQERD